MTAEAEGRDAAERFRADHRLGRQPLGNLLAIIEQTTNVDVAVVKAPPGEHGMAMRDSQQGTIFVVVAKTPHPMRQRSSLDDLQPFLDGLRPPDGHFGLI